MAARSSRRVQVVCLSGGRLGVEVQETDTAADLKFQIEETFGTPAAHQRLIFDGRCLDDAEALESEVFAANGPVVYLLVRASTEVSARPHERLRDGCEGVLVHTLDGKHFAVEATGTDTIQMLKAKIRQKVGVLPHHQRLIYSGEELEDDCVLESKGIRSQTGVAMQSLRACGDVLHLLTKQEDLPINIGSFVERELDGMRFQAVVLKRNDRPQVTLDLKYVDDGNVEEGVPLADCRLSRKR